MKPAISLHLFHSTLISFISLLQFQFSNLIYVFIQFVPSILSFFGAIVQFKMFSFQSFIANLQKYDFCCRSAVTFLHSVLSSLIDSTNCLGRVFETFCAGTYVIRKQEQFLFLPFQLRCLTSFSSLIALVSRRILNKSGGCGRSYGKSIKTFTIKYNGSLGFLDVLFQVRKVPSIASLLRVFFKNHVQTLNFIKCFSCIH